MPSFLSDELNNTTLDDPFFQRLGERQQLQDKRTVKGWPSQPLAIHNNYETTPPRTPTDSSNSTNDPVRELNGDMFIDDGLNTILNGRLKGSWESRPDIDSNPLNGILPGNLENGRKTPTLQNGASNIISPGRNASLSSNRSTRQTQEAIAPQPSSNGDIDMPKKTGPPTDNHTTSNQQLFVPATHDVPVTPTRNSSVHRFSAPECPPKSLVPQPMAGQLVGPPQLKHRHTLQVPKPAPARGSIDDALSTGRFSPTVATGLRRGSLSMNRRNTQSIHSNMPHEEVIQDEDALRWAEAIRQKRASKRKRKDEEDDERVVVGTKVDQNHVNWVTAYNMLTGIRFTVSRTNAKMDRPLTDADFAARHKFSFDITGNELTPSAKYDFKFKDYAPWVFRHLRAHFKLDPADYLMSLTSKYILSELGSPGKSGSFFYFSRDYKYIIKTIHHAEHKLLRRILKDYYNHVEANPNTLLSQFYGLHRVKIPYGRKIHFVVMNNLFPPHRDIHQTFDLKGSTIGRDFREEDLEKNPRATLKDLNWLRRNYHLEFGPDKKHVFLDQMQNDVHLLQKLKIMDYSMLVGIHDLEKGNQENVRDKTLRVFQPGGDTSTDELAPTSTILSRTPSKLENARKAHELRKIIKHEKPVPMGQTTRMPELEENPTKREFTFYSDDGGFRATHEDNSPGEEIYYLGIIDLLTHYGTVKRLENFWKGLSQDKQQISPIPPVPYGDRFIKFVKGITMSPEEAERQAAAAKNVHSTEATRPFEPQLVARTNTDNSVIQGAERQARKTEMKGADESNVPDRVLTTQRSSSAERSGDRAGMTLPIVDEAGESASTGGRSGSSVVDGVRPPPTPPKDKESVFLQPPEVPPKEPSLKSRRSFDSNKALPMLPKIDMAENEKVAA